MLTKTARLQTSVQVSMLFLGRENAKSQTREVEEVMAGLVTEVTALIEISEIEEGATSETLIEETGTFANFQV